MATAMAGTMEVLVWDWATMHPSSPRRSSAKATWAAMAMAWVTDISEATAMDCTEDTVWVWVWVWDMDWDMAMDTVGRDTPKSSKVKPNGAGTSV